MRVHGRPKFGARCRNYTGDMNMISVRALFGPELHGFNMFFFCVLRKFIVRFEYAKLNEVIRVFSTAIIARFPDNTVAQ